MSAPPRGLLVTGALAWRVALDEGLDPATLSNADWLQRLGDAPRRATFAAKLAAAGRAVQIAKIHAEVEAETKQIAARVEGKARKVERRAKAEKDSAAEFHRVLRQEEVAMAKRAKEESARRKELREAAEAFGLEPDVADGMSDEELRLFVKQHTLSADDDDDKAAIAAALAASMIGTVDDCPRLAPHVLARFRADR